MEKETKQKVIKKIKRYIFMIIGCVFYALSLRMFLDPCMITGGGVSGAALFLEYLTKIPASVFILIINIPISIFGFKLMGWKFSIRCVITYFTLSLFTYIFALIEFDATDPILASLYGGVFQGIGIGLFIKFRMSSGGTELLGRITNHYIPIGSIAIHTAIFDGIIVIVSAIVMRKPENILYALILIFVSAKVSDLIVLGIEKAKLCYIITEKEEEIADYLIKHSPRGVTLIKGKGMYSKQPKGILMTCIKTKQIVYLKSTVKKFDENAFVIVCDANEVYGKGFNGIEK